MTGARHQDHVRLVNTGLDKDETVEFSARLISATAEPSCDIQFRIREAVAADRTGTPEDRANSNNR